MRKLVLGIAFSISILCQSQVIRSEFEWVNTLRYESMSGLSIRGADTILVVGNNGLIARSTDHGHNWDKQYVVPNNYLNDVLFCSPNMAIVVGNKGSIYKSDNAGIDWVKINSGTTYNIKALAATSIDNIWAVGDSSLILHSTDRGQTWQKLNLATSLTNFSDVEFKNSTGYITGYSDNVYMTSDNGNNWTRVSDNVIDSKTQNFYTSISMTEHKTILLEFGAFYYSNDNTNWIKGEFNFGGVSGLHFVTDSIAYATTVYVTTCGCGSGVLNIYKSTNGGINWLNVYNSGGGFFTSKFKFINDSVGYYLNDRALFITPVTGEFGNNIYDALEKIQQPTVNIKQESGKLIINADNKAVETVEIRNMSGMLVRRVYYQGSVMQVELNIESLPIGIYLTRTVLNDNSIHMSKWIKY